MGDRILVVDGIILNGRTLVSVMKPADTHSFEVERIQGWSGFSIEETDVTDEADEANRVLDKLFAFLHDQMERKERRGEKLKFTIENPYNPASGMHKV